MPRSRDFQRPIVPQVENNFIGGLITEASALNFPPNACTDTDNCVFHPKGTVYRRFGMDYEAGYASRTVARSANAMSSFTWVNPAGQDKTFFVVQIGRYIYFYNVADAAVSAGAHATVIDMDAYKTSTAQLLAQNECQFASGQGYLFVVHPYSEPFYIEYTPATDAITSASITVNVRDTDGVVDETGYAYDTRPTTLTDLHTYNLYNQGWMSTSSANYIGLWRVNRTTTDYYWTSSSPPPIPVTRVVAFGNANYPSNADVWWMCQGADLTFWPNLADTNKRGNTPAPKGYFILKAWNMDRATASGIVGIPGTTSGVNRPSTIAFFAGRCFYAGCNATDYSNKLYFTQVIKNKEQFGRCHQQNDPTNKDLFDILATDGGFVSIPDAGRIVKLISIQNALIIFATNGVWILSGNQNIGFSASDYSIRRVSSIPAIAPQSFVDVEGLPVWWNYDGIYMVTEVNNAGGIKIESLTDQTIRTYYKEKIPTTAKPYVVGSYNQLTKEIRWLWRSAAVSTFEQNYEYDRALTFNMLTKAFTPWSFNQTLARVCGIASLKTRGTFRQEPSLGVMSDVTSFQGSVFKYIISNPNGTSITFGETKNSSFKDFYGVDTVGVDYESYFVTGYREEAGGASRRFQSNYVVVYARYRDNPQFYFRSLMDFSNAESSMRWSANQLIQFPETGAYDYQMKKIKVRGTGRGIQFRVSSVSGKPFELVGWSRWQTANTGI